MGSSEGYQGWKGREDVIWIHRSDENEGVESVRQPQAEHSDDEADGHSEDLPFAHLCQLLEESSHKVKQVSC